MNVQKPSNADRMGFSWVRRARSFWVLALLATIALTGCRQPQPVVLAYYPFPGYAPAYLAESLELWPLELVKTRQTANALQSSELLRAGEVDAALLTLDETIRLANSGVALRVALVVDQSLGADVMLARQPISDLTALRGRRLGHEVEAVGELFAQAVLDKAGLTPSEVQLVPVGFDRHEVAWHEGKVDFLITFHPVSARLRKEGAAVIFSSRQTPELILDVMVVREQSFQAKKKALLALVGGWFLGLEHVQRYEGDTRFRLAGWLGVSPEEVYAGFDGLELFDAAENRAWLRFNEGERFTQTAHKLAAWMAQHGLLTQALIPKLGVADLLPDPEQIR